MRNSVVARPQWQTLLYDIALGLFGVLIMAALIFLIVIGFMLAA